jgi:diguanylate cyclase (GGDEF)-like protein/PAS domain S-box-containing protein
MRTSSPSPTGPLTRWAPIQTSPEPVLAISRAGTVTFASAAAERLLGYAPGELPGTSALHLVPPSRRRACARLLRRLGDGPPAFPKEGGELPACTKSGQLLRLEVRPAAPPPGDGGLALLLHDVTRRSGAERRLRAAHAITRTLAEAAREEAVPRVLGTLCRALRYEVGLLWEVEPDAPVLCYAGGWAAPGAGVESFLEMTRRMACLPGVELPGRAWEARTPLWAPEVAREPGFLRAPAAVGCGLRCACALPVLLGGNLFGVLELFARGGAEPDAGAWALLEAAGCGLAQLALRRRSEAEAAERETRFRALIEYGSDLITVLDERGRIRFQSPSVERVLGYTPKELLGREPFALLHPDDAFRARKTLALALRTPGVAITLEHRVQHRDGSWRTLESVARSLLHARAVRGVVVNSRDVTTRRKVENEVRRLSLTDELTGLHNRRGFFALAAQQLRQAQRGGGEVLLLFVDVDRLKPINDRHGHAEGDRMLVDAAHLLRQSFRQSDVLARVGGDEFVVLAVESSRARGEALVARLAERVRAWNAAREGRPPLSLSVGVAWYDPERLCTVDALLAAADAAMYRRKRGGSTPSAPG